MNIKQDNENPVNWSSGPSRNQKRTPKNYSNQVNQYLVHILRGRLIITGKTEEYLKGNNRRGLWICSSGIFRVKETGELLEEIIHGGHPWSPTYCITQYTISRRRSQITQARQVVFNSNIHGITKPVIRRLTSLNHEATRGTFRAFLWNVLHDITNTEHAKSKINTAANAVFAFKISSSLSEQNYRNYLLYVRLA